MSVIAWDGKILAADRLAEYGDTLASATKIRKLANGVVVAFSGNLDAGRLVARWYEDGADPAKWPETQKDKDMWSALIVVSPLDGAFWYERLPEAIPVEDPFKAWGCGKEAAIGAMAMGADAIKAVEIASMHITGCGRGCDWFRITDK